MSTDISKAVALLRSHPPDLVSKTLEAGIGFNGQVLRMRAILNVIATYLEQHAGAGNLQEKFAGSPQLSIPPVKPTIEQRAWAIVHATQHLVSDIEIDGNDVLAHLENNCCDTWMDPEGDGNLFDTTNEDRADLTRRLSLVFHEWAADKHMNAWAFRNQTPGEWVEIPHPGPQL